MDCQLFMKRVEDTTSPSDVGYTDTGSAWVRFFADPAEVSVIKYNTFCRELLMGKYVQCLRTYEAYRKPSNIAISVVPGRFSSTPVSFGPDDSLEKFADRLEMLRLFRNSILRLEDDLRISFVLPNQLDTAPFPPAVSMYLLIAGTNLRTIQKNDERSYLNAVILALLDPKLPQYSGTFSSNPVEGIMSALFLYCNWHNRDFGKFYSFYGYETGPGTYMYSRIHANFQMFCSFIEEYQKEIKFLMGVIGVGKFPEFFKANLEYVINKGE